MTTAEVEQHQCFILLKSLKICSMTCRQLSSHHMSLSFLAARDCFGSQRKDQPGVGRPLEDENAYWREMNCKNKDWNGNKRCKNWKSVSLLILKLIIRERFFRMLSGRRRQKFNSTRGQAENDLIRFNWELFFSAKGTECLGGFVANNVSI